MDESWTYVEVMPIETKADLLLVAAPSYGNVGPAAAHILIDEVGLPLVGTFQCDLFPPAAVSWKGAVAGPIQVWGAPMRSGPEGAGGGVLLLNVDVPMPPELLMHFARAVVDWAKAREVALIVTLEGEARSDENPGGDMTRAANLGAETLATKLSAVPRHGSLVGTAPAFLVHGNRAGVPVVSLFAPADVAEGDARAAMHALHTLAPFVPALAVGSPAFEARAGPAVQRVVDEQAKHRAAIERLSAMTMRGYV